MNLTTTNTCVSIFDFLSYPTALNECVSGKKKTLTTRLRVKNTRRRLFQCVSASRRQVVDSFVTRTYHTSYKKKNTMTQTTRTRDNEKSFVTRVMNKNNNNRMIEIQATKVWSVTGLSQLKADSDINSKNN